MSVNTELLKNRDFRNTLFAIGANQLSDSYELYHHAHHYPGADRLPPEAAGITLFVAGVLATCAGAISGTWVDRIGPSKCLALSCIGRVTVLDIDSSLPRFQRHQYLRFGDHDFAAIISTFDYPSEQSIITR